MKHYIYGLYKKNCTDSNRQLFYIGITSGDKNLYFRKNNHYRESANKQKLNIINKYDFDLKILWSVKTRKEAEEREEFLIRWFGRIKDGGTLCNICENAKDVSKARTYIRKNKKRRKATKEEKISNRNRNLTVPYNEIIKLIKKWAKNPLETQQNFAKKHGISRSKFKDWLRLYAPEYIGLTKKIQKEKFDSIQKENKTVKEIISEFSNITGYSYEKSKGVYYRLIRYTKEKME